MIDAGVQSYIDKIPEYKNTLEPIV